MVNDHGQMKVLKARNGGEDQKSFNKAGKMVLRRLDRDRAEGGARGALAPPLFCKNKNKFNKK